jgi:hypothetical protein
MTQTLKKKARMLTKENEGDEKGILASLIFLKGEVKKANMRKTEKAIDEAITAFFKDFQRLNQLDENLEIIQSFLRRVLSLEKNELDNFIKLIQFFDNPEENKTRN